MTRLACIAALALVAFSVFGAGAATSDTGDFGYAGGIYTGAGTDPTASKPESKLWWNDGYWWGILWEPASSDFHIYRLDQAAQQWVDTGVAVDTRSGTRSDVLSTGTKLYVATHVFTNTASAGAASRLHRYTYNGDADTYSIDAGFPVAINNYRTETLVIDKERTSSTLWATWVQDSQVMVSHTVGGNDATWTTPFAVPTEGASNVTTDDISSVVAFGDKIGVLYGNQNTQTFYFAVHANGAADSAWSVETVVSGPLMADDHINLKVDSANQVWAVTKTGHTPASLSTDPYVLLNKRSASGTWTSHVVAIQGDRWTRPIVLLEEGNRNVHVFGTSGEAGGTIYQKTSSMDAVSFEPGKGTPYITDASSLSMNNATSTKQNLDDDTDLVVLAAHPGTSTYWHNYTFLGVADTTPPTAPTSLTATSTSWDQVDLTWTASTDNVGVVGYDVYRNGSLLTTTGSTTTFADTSVAGSTTYTYEIRARDHVGNVSDPSNQATVTTTTAPAVLRFTPDADASVHEGTPNSNFGTDTTLRVDGGADPDVDSYLRFTVSGVIGTVRSVGLRIYASTGTLNGPAVYGSSNLWSEPEVTWASRPPRTGPAVDDKGTITPNTWAEWNVTPLVGGDGTYTFAVATNTTDGVNLNSREAANTPELVVSFDPGAADTTPPTAPTALTTTVTSWDRVDLDWNASTDNSGIAGYNVYRDGSLLVATTGTATTYADMSVASNRTYAYEVKARDFAGNLSPASNTATATTPESPRTLTFAADADARVEETTATTNFGTSSELKTDGGASADIESYLRFTVSGVVGTYLSAKLRLYAVTQTADGPAVYTSANDWSENGITWSSRPPRTGSGTDDKGGIAGGWVEWDVTPLVTGDGTYTFVLATLSADGITFHSREGVNAPELIVTYDPADRVPPTAPGSLTATAAGSDRVDLTWTASTDNFGVTAYEIYRNGGLLTTTAPGTTFTDATVSGNTTYTYEVRARDQAQNISGPSNAASVTTPPTPTILRVVTEADARVAEATPSTNFGTATQLRVDGGPDPDVESYLRFAVSGITGTIESVKLRIRAATDSADGPAVFTSPSEWLEAGITWSSRPPRSGSGTDDKGPIATGAWVEWDVTPLVTGNGTYTLVLATTSTDGLNFHSRETANKPELVVTFR